LFFYSHLAAFTWDRMVSVYRQCRKFEIFAETMKNLLELCLIIFPTGKQGVPLVL
jgi:hypothetical protein